MNSTTSPNLHPTAEATAVDVRDILDLEAVLVGGGDVSGVGY